MADGTEFRTDRAGSPPPPADTEAASAITARTTVIEEARRRFIPPEDRRMVELTRVGEVPRIVSKLWDAMPPGRRLAMEVLVRAVAMMTYPNNRNEEPIPGTTDPEKPAC